jgi:hypothetical protein
MGGAPVFEKENSLPGAELHFSIGNRDSLAGVRQRHANVRGAVVSAFSRVEKVVQVFWNKTLEKFFKVPAGGWIGVFHDNQAAAGVLHENRGQAVAHLALVDLVLHLVGDFVSALSVRSNFEFFVLHAHKFRPEINIDNPSSRALIFRLCDGLVK